MSDVLKTKIRGGHNSISGNTGTVNVVYPEPPWLPEYRDEIEGYRNDVLDAKGYIEDLTVSATTLDPDDPATVTKTLVSDHYNFDFGLPKGDKGDTGATGQAATVSVGTVSSGATASVTNTGTSSAAVFDFVLPKGDAGSPGAAATISVGTVTTLSAGSSATITNTGTSSAAVFDFGIPKGDKGDTGNTGETGATGRRGGITLRTTTAPSGYSTPVGDFTPAGRIALATVLSQSGATEVYVGDAIECSTYRYGVGAVDSTYVYTSAGVSIKGDKGDTGLPGGVFYGECSTSGSTAAKEVTITGFSLTEGVRVAVKFTNDNTADKANISLNVSSTGAKPIRILTYNDRAYIQSNSYIHGGYTYEFYYDGDYWIIWYNYDTTYGKMSQAQYEAGTSTTGMTISPLDLKGAIQYWGGSSYSQMTDADIATGTSTNGMVVSPKTLVDNFSQAQAVVTSSDGVEKELSMTLAGTTLTISFTNA